MQCKEHIRVRVAIRIRVELGVVVGPWVTIPSFPASRYSSSLTPPPEGTHPSRSNPGATHSHECASCRELCRSVSLDGGGSSGSIWGNHLRLQAGDVQVY